MTDIVYQIVRCNTFLADGALCSRTTTFPVSPETKVDAMNWKCHRHTLKQLGKCYSCGDHTILQYDGRAGGIICGNCLDNLRREGLG